MANLIRNLPIFGWLALRFELSRGGAASNVRPMEGLRGFAVFLVFLVHYVTTMEPLTPENSVTLSLANAMHTIGNAGVDLFFVLSGYLIYGSLITRAQPFVSFMARRVKRIYPTFVVVFVVYLGLSYVFPAENKIPIDILPGVTYLLQNLLLLPGLYPVEPLITVAWSLSYEMFYYLAIPLAIVFFGLRKRTVLWRASFFTTIALITAIYTLAFGGHIRLIMFIAGILLYEAMESRHIPTPHSLHGLLALVFGLLALLLPVAGSAGITLKEVILFCSFFLLCLTCFREPSAWLPRAFTWTPLRWLGNMSYSYYLLHGLALKAGFLLLATLLPLESLGAWAYWALLPVMFALTVPPSVVLFLVVERPFSLAPRKIT